MRHRLALAREGASNARAVRLAALTVAVVPTLTAGCAGGESAEDGPLRSRDAGRPGTVERATEPAALPSRVRCASAGEARLGNRRVAFAARATGRVVAFRRPGSARVRAFARKNVNGVETVFGVLGAVRDDRCRTLWYRVQLPMWPNGTTGYVRADDVIAFRVRTRIEVDLSRRQIDFYRGGRRMLRATAAVGSPENPTPVGRYYVNQRLRARDAAGPFGPGAIGISAFAPFLTGWTQGGPIAIHGTNDPSSLGKAVSYGCLRIANRHLVRMFLANPEGTPVVVRA